MFSAWYELHFWTPHGAFIFMAKLLDPEAEGSMILENISAIYQSTLCHNPEHLTWEIRLARGNLNTQRETCPSATLTTKNPTQIGLGLNPACKVQG